MPRPRSDITVSADDGVGLHVEFDGDPDAPLTMVLTHGFTASSAEWDQQRPVLRERVEMVLWDHRGHGHSGWTHLTKATIDQTARDLGTVLDATVPAGPIVLVGHSMGGMSIMALARQRPELFGDRVVGVLLLATSAGGLARTGVVGRWVRILRRLGLLTRWLGFLQAVSPRLERHRRRGSSLGHRFVRHYLFGFDDAHPELVRRVQVLLEQTPYPVTMAFYGTLLDHHEEASLAVLRRVPVTVVAATHDRLTPARHGRRIAELLGDSVEFVLIRGAGHSVNATRPDQVNAAFLSLLDRVERRLAANGSAGTAQAAKSGESVPPGGR
jgi:pimeloyl-ACP methyl ester carboxylesterase